MNPGSAAADAASLSQMLRAAVPLVLAMATTLWVARQSTRRGLDPPGFGDPIRRGPGQFGAGLRRGLGWSLVAVGLYVGVFGSLATLGLELEWQEPSSAATLFLLHAVFVAALSGFALAGYLTLRRPPHIAAGAAVEDTPSRGRSTLLLRHLRLAEAHVGRELVLGMGVGVGIWAVVLGLVMVFALVLSGLQMESALPSGISPMVVWIVAQPIGIRLLVSASAGVVEEIFFRGFLQPRIGIPLSTALFAFAHIGYGEPFMLFGVTLLSLAYALLARWRRSIWAAVGAHFVFDAVQLLVLIPVAAAAAESGVTGALFSAVSVFSHAGSPLLDCAALS